MKPAIQNREDVITLIDAFYRKARKDELIGPIFQEVIGSNWDRHMPIMYDFWEGILFHTDQYAGNPMQVHQQLNRRIPLQAAHFDRWKQLFLDTTRELFEGPKAELAMQRAVSIATMMQIKLATGGQ
ncbi:MAG: group III truncated hemoglobin [Candidatus Pseudobacter hemicellulosilyticus]|uniref:Group III truncated hemoglobin n=1 Tax=Candidatus Pseudobacter hemicellulosilyticus TaxID=3121375 RepID=A0AAJ5WPU2_9BACT|nr:MAG: group III truncated hemoglobin [Pseudobacter sp.]